MLEEGLRIIPDCCFMDTVGTRRIRGQTPKNPLWSLKLGEKCLHGAWFLRWILRFMSTCRNKMQQATLKFSEVLDTRSLLLQLWKYVPFFKPHTNLLTKPLKSFRPQHAAILDLVWWYTRYTYVQFIYSLYCRHVYIYHFIQWYDITEVCSTCAQSTNRKPGRSRYM